MSKDIDLIKNKNIQSKIYTIRGMQVMLDRDLAALYGVETRALKQAVKRNIKRFPADFMFELTNIEVNSMVSQSVIPSKKYFGGAKPFAFTEQGVSSLSGVLSSNKAIEINIKIMRAFVEMRKFILTNAQIFQRLDTLEMKQVKTDKVLNSVLNAIDEHEIKPKKGIFFDGQVFDSYVFVSKLIKKAKQSIVVIDNYVDESVLTLLAKRKKNVRVTILTKNISKALQLDVDKHNAQYASIEVKAFNKSHDRFLIIDKKEIYHIGASLKDLGKKWFAFSKMDATTLKILDKM